MKYFSYDPDDGFEFHATEKEAKDRCQNAFDNAIEESSCDGWPENTDDICWGEVKERVVCIERIDRPTDSELDSEHCDGAGNDWSNPDWDRIENRELRTETSPSDGATGAAQCPRETINYTVTDDLVFEALKADRDSLRFNIGRLCELFDCKPSDLYATVAALHTNDASADGARGASTEIQSVPESAGQSDTPECDAELGGYECLNPNIRQFAERLERQRDEAKSLCKKTFALGVKTAKQLDEATRIIEVYRRVNSGKCEHHD